MLEALKLYLNIPQIIFIIGLDRDVVDGVLLKHYRDNGLGEDKSKDYLSKIFQVEFSISPTEQQLQGFYENQIANINDSTDNYWTNNLIDEHSTVIEEAVKVLARNNPREMKRLLNSSFLRGYEAAQNDELNDETHANLSDEETSKLRFAQGIQIFLIQKRPFPKNWP